MTDSPPPRETSPLTIQNTLRKSLYPERFPDHSAFFPNGTRDADMSIHLGMPPHCWIGDAGLTRTSEHCIDRIRQATMCASNLGAMYWRWLDDIKVWNVDMRTTHTCRNFEDIRKWAVERNLPHWDNTVPSRLTFEQ